MRLIINITCFIYIITQTVLMANSWDDEYIRARSLYLAGDYEGAELIASEIVAYDCEHTLAKTLCLQSRKKREEYIKNQKKQLRKDLILEVDNAWQYPLVGDGAEGDVCNEASVVTKGKLDSILVPTVNFAQAPLSYVVQFLAALSEQYDMEAEDAQQKGVNVVLVDPEKRDPHVTLSVRNVTLRQLLHLITQSVGFQFFVENNIVIVRHKTDVFDNLETKFFPISRGTIIRMTGHRDVFSPSDYGNSGPTQHEEELALKLFFQRSGVPFDPELHGPDGAQFAFDGSKLIITQTPRNLEKVANILARYKNEHQVEIESKFLEVQEGVLEELGFRWNVSSGHNPGSRFFRTHNGDSNNLRSLSGAFNNVGGATGDGKIVNAGGAFVSGILNRSPVFPNAINLGTGGTAAGGVLSVIDDWSVSLMIDALEQHSGSDLMSAPKVTVLSGKTAKITVAQILRFPESYGDIQSAVGTAGADVKNSSAGVTITAGTPQNFVEKNVGVEMAVTPVVNEQAQSISLKLDPKVTEFEGFVEYGGRSIAISGDTTVDVPSGFFQPIFSTRQIQTEVTIKDGATVVMGGLTREEVKQVRDKVPILGDIPLLGRLFQSKGESSQKKNLLIFVTARVVSKGNSEPLACLKPRMSNKELYTKL